LKKLSGEQIRNIDFQLNEPSIKTDNDLNRHYLHFPQTLVSISHSQDENLPHISLKDIKKKINNLKRTSTCPSDIPIVLVKAFAEKLSLPLVDIFCTITESGCYKDTWKQRFLTPIQKKGAEEGFNEVQPIKVT